MSARVEEAFSYFKDGFCWSQALETAKKQGSFDRCPKLIQDAVEILEEIFGR
jgi:hypothetical protein